jgi:hypothetical protein
VSQIYSYDDDASDLEEKIIEQYYESDEFDEDAKEWVQEDPERNIDAYSDSRAFSNVIEARVEASKERDYGD